MEVILTHHNADFDGLAATLAAHKLFPAAVPLLPKRLSQNVKEFLTLYRNGLPFIYWDDFKGDQTIERIILVDTQRLPGTPKGATQTTPVLAIEHHPLDDDLPDHITYDGEDLGAVTTLLVERIRAAGDVQLSSLEVTLLALGIYADTGALTYSNTTPRDLLAAAWLLEQNAVLDTVRRFMSTPLNDEQQALFGRLVKSSESRDIQGYTITVATVEVDRQIKQINSVAQRLMNMLDPAALFVIVQMPNSLQMVCRSQTDAVNVGLIADHFGGGGHTRAAAATIEAMTLSHAHDDLWHQLNLNVEPIKRVADLMSYGVQTLQADQPITEVIAQLRRIGHEGYPVLDEENAVIGLLTRRDADRAMEHGLKKARVRDVMVSGEISLQPDDSVHALEQLMVESTWGQIPIVNPTPEGETRVIGIVTRTDLIKHWAQTHPTIPKRQVEKVDPDHMEEVLGYSVTEIIEEIAAHARRQEMKMYMVGGIVRDLLLKRPNYDIDFVIEGDAIKFAQELAAVFGGEATYFRPFGTAKWRIDRERLASNLHIEAAQLPDHIDFATSRNEFYEHPTALPSVYNSSIKLDLQRRDFTINTIAVQMSPHHSAHQLLDFYGGADDLERGVIRVLHSLSFVDDPTRALRAVRFEQRLGFTIEPRTAELIKTSRSMLRRITGQRLQNELTLLLKEDAPEQSLLVLQERSILPAIHLAFHFTPEAANSFQQARETRDQWPLQVDDITTLYWHLIMAHIEFEGQLELCERLMFGRTMIDSFTAVGRLIDTDNRLHKPDATASQITQFLDGTSEIALLASWILLDGEPRQRIIAYIEEWRHIKPKTDGNILKSLGLSPGPRYSLILDILRAARINGEVTTDEQEHALAKQLVEEHIRDRT